MRLARGLLLVAFVAAPALAVACNGILGIDAPTLRSAGLDGSTGADGTSPRESGRGDTARHDGLASDAPRDTRALDGGADVVGDARRPPKDGAADGSDGARGFDGHCACPDGGACPPVVLASGQTDPTRLIADPEAGVFWLNGDQSSGSVWHTGLDGTGTRALATGQALPSMLRYVDGVVFWVDLITGTLHWCKSASCTATALPGSFGDSYGMAASKGAVYVANDLTGSIQRYDVAGGAPVDAGAGAVVVGPSIGSITGVGVDSQHIYWGASPLSHGQSFDGGTGVFVCPLGGCVGDPIQLGTSFLPSTLVVDETSIYWSDSNGVYSAPLAGGATRMLAPSASLNPHGQLVTDGVSLYLSSGLDVVRLSKDGATVVTLATDTTAPADVAVAGSCVYWLDPAPDAGHVYASPK